MFYLWWDRERVDVLFGRPSFASDIHIFILTNKDYYDYREWIRLRISGKMKTKFRGHNCKSFRVYILSIIFFFNFSQLLVCILIGLHYNSFNAGDQHTAMITMGTFGGYLIILVGLFIGSVMGTPVNRRVVC